MRKFAYQKILIKLGVVQSPDQKHFFQTIKEARHGNSRSLISHKSVFGVSKMDLLLISITPKLGQIFPVEDFLNFTIG